MDGSLDKVEEDRLRRGFLIGKNSERVKALHAEMQNYTPDVLKEVYTIWYKIKLYYIYNPIVI